MTKDNVGTKRVVHCYGQTSAVAEAISTYLEASEEQRIEARLTRPQYDKYENGRSWQPTVCGIRAPSADVIRPSDFVATVNHTDPNVDKQELEVALEFPGSPYMDGTPVLDVVPCSPCKDDAPSSWPFLEYFSNKEQAITS